MLLSVIIPIYNAEKYLRECIDSVINQSYQDFELLLVDDGSEDSSMIICREYENKDDRIKVITGEHKGPYFSRKKGVENAKGRYITFLDADDFISDKAYIMAEDDMRKSIDIISFGMSRYFDESNIRYEKGLISEGIYDQHGMEEKIFPSMLWDSDTNSFGMDPSLGNKLYKASLLKKHYNNSKDVRFHYGEDVAVIYPLILKAKNISFHQEIYYYHRQRQKDILPPYIKDDLYLDKLYELYKYLSKSMCSNKIFQKQIDLFYIHSVELAKVKYGIISYPENVIFPFDKIKKGERIIIYGAGNIGRLYVKQLKMLDYCDVILWADKNYELFSSEVSNPEEILEVEYDKVIIAIADQNVKKQATKSLLKLGIRRETII